MFKEKFNEEMQKIKPSSLSKAQLLEKINNEQQKADVIPFKRSAKKGWIAVLAAAVAICIVSVAVLNLPFFKSPSELAGEIEYTDGIPARVTYAQIYNKFSEILKQQERSYYTTGTDDIILEDALDEEMAVPDGAGGDLGSLKGENGTAKPDSAIDVNENATELYSEEYSTTNTQVADVDEADIIKTDGKFIYSVSSILKSKNQRVNISKAEKGQLENVSVIELKFNDSTYIEISDIYLTSKTLAIIINSMGEENNTILRLYDVSTPYAPKQKKEVTFSGNLLSSRLIKNNIYLFTNEYFYEKPNENDVCSYVPSVQIDGDAPCPVAEEDICIFKGAIDRSYTSVFLVDTESGKITDSKSTVGGGSTIYANTKAIYLAANDISSSYFTRETIDEYKNKTRLIRFDIKDGGITAVAEGEVDGTPLNQFSMDEHNGYFRIVTTVTTAYDTKNAVYVLDSQLKIVGKTTDIAKGERVYSVRFMGDTGYFVTFRQVDPLFAVDLSNPKEPKILSALKIPGFSNYMHPWGDGMMLGIGADADEKTGAVKGIKLSMFDISDPKNVTEKDKEILDILGSDVGVEHKAILANFNKNLIGFAANDGNYYLYSYAKDKGFTKKATLKIPRNEDAEIYYSYYFYAQNTRGIYIGDYFYLCGPNGINSYSLLNFKEIDSLIY
ncbi:MAG: beta-propeller domain-containing protein [Clostridia bacterium]|nr:beta-propeller domain-containing protein [Clostridia bacterium]